MTRSRQPDPPEVVTAIAGQAAWAARQGLALNPRGSGLADRRAAIFGGMDDDTRAQLRDGEGQELKKIHSLRSSTALAVNVFQPWKAHPREIGTLFGSKAATTLRFEQKQPIWPPKGDDTDPTPPHLDVLLTGLSGPTIGIESKFVEMYSPASNSFRPAYFPTDELDPPLWAGLPGCRALATRIASGEEVFASLAAGQLLKHALGLSKNQPDGFRLVLAWYRIEGPTADLIEEEIGRFSRAVAAVFDFTAITYQELISQLSTQARTQAPMPVPRYYEYLTERYGLGVEPLRPLPLITLGKAAETKQKTGLTSRTTAIDIVRLTADYYQTTARAPQRSTRPTRMPYLMPTHDGRGGADPGSREKLAAKAVFNRGLPLDIGAESVAIIDYEVPLAARGTDDGVGDIDLLGLGASSTRPWIIELKVGASNEPPFSALLQALRYSAMLDANRRQLGIEIEARTGVPELAWPAVVVVAADSAYWDRWQQESKAAGDWLPVLRQLGAAITGSLGIEVVFVELGSVEVKVIDGAARLTSALEVRVL